MQCLQKSGVFLPTRRFGTAEPEGLGTARGMHTRVAGVDPRCSCVQEKTHAAGELLELCESAQPHKCEFKPPYVLLRAAGCIPTVTFPPR